MKIALKGNGFTLIELLVVITIIVVLASITFAVTGNLRQRAGAVKRISDVRQSGIILLSKASETDNRCQYFTGGSGSFELRPYYIVKVGVGLGIYDSAEIDIMSWDSRKLPPKLPAWNCRAVNFKNVPKHDAIWKNGSVKDSQGRVANVSTLFIGTVSRPGAYPLLIDSSKSTGEETFRINEGNGDCVGLREAGMKANAFMLDGSVRSMGVAELKAAGFTKAYDNSTTPPKLINF
jgi:prepilin-type N-terminal cleavage/methylation domain-containing protein